MATETSFGFCDFCGYEGVRREITILYGSIRSVAWICPDTDACEARQDAADEKHIREYDAIMRDRE